MKLFLASRMSNQLTIKKLEECVGGLKNKTIVYIPTAANAEGLGRWKNSETWRTIRKLGAITIPVHLEDYRNTSVVEEIESVKPNIIWFAGGYPGYLMYWVMRCSLDKYLPKILGDKVWYVGSSAGAMVAGQSLEVATFGFTDNERGASDIKTMNLVNFDIFPHYQDKFLSKVKKNYKGKKLYLLKDGEEIIVEDDKITVIGEERIITND
ncbi:MAG TPA: Type 1 glutamine amidotransferase-like domain-containing protein [Alphaproteobacteria bacterium]|jgi:dipeptidase E|nr:Type 1 glutamine amidotransferase-like domain-containing protein [Alphaproteobacteria bacterium]